MVSRILSGALSGYFLYLSFDFDRWYFGLISQGILIFTLSKSYRRQRLVTLISFSTIFFLSHLTWVKVIGIDAWIALSIIASLPWLLLTFVRVNPKRLRSLAFFSASVVLVEVIRSHFPWGGFPWGLIAYSQLDGPLISFAPLGGQALVSFIVVFLAGLFVRSFSGKLISSLAFIVVIFSVNLYSDGFISDKTLNVVAIQGNVPRIGLDVANQRKEVLNNHLELTEKFLEENVSKVDLVIWPESSTDIDPLTNREVGEQIQSVINKAGVPFLVGATTWGSNPEGPRNTGIYWREDGQKSFYTKNHLVPFGEYIPFRDFLSGFTTRIDLVPNDFVPGIDLGIFEINGVTFGDVICFEVVYGDYMRLLTRSGAQFIAIQTNNATYGRTEQPEQQFQISRFRAIEHNRAIIIASTSGISGAIDPNGQVLAKTGEFEPAVVQVDLPIVDDLSFSDRYPRWMALLCGSIVLLGLLKARLRQPKKFNK